MKRRTYSIWRHCWRITYPRQGEFTVATPLFILQTGCYTPDIYNPDRAWSGIKFALVNPFIPVEEGHVIHTLLQFDWIWHETNTYHEFLKRGF